MDTCNGRTRAAARVRGLASPPTMDDNDSTSGPSEVLLVKLSSMGDVIHNLPVVCDVLRAFPQARIDWVVEEAYAGLVRLHPGVSRVIPYAGRRWRKTPFTRATRADLGAFVHALRARRYDAILDTQSLVKSALVARIGHGTRWGWTAEACRERAASWFYDRRVSAPAYHRVVAVERYRDLAARALGYTPVGAPAYGLAPIARPPSWMPADRPYVVLLTATARAEKRWNDDAWAEVVRGLASSGLACLFAWGEPHEREGARRIAHAAMRDGAVHEDAVRIAPEPLPLAQWAEVLAGAALAIGVDTGLVFLAAAVGTPVVAVYVATSPAHVGITSAGPHRNLGDVGAPPGVGEVLEAALALQR